MNNLNNFWRVAAAMLLLFAGVQASAQNITYEEIYRRSKNKSYFPQR